MDLYSSTTYPHEDGTAEKVKSGMIYASKEELLRLCDFFEKVKSHIVANDTCHMHLCDYDKDWAEGKDFDVEVNIRN